LNTNWTNTCAVVIPCCNEETTIAALVTEARRYLPLIIAVDDGSTDQTASRAAAAGAQVLPQGNHGKGAALKAGLALVRQQNCQWAITLDGDGQHRPDDIPAFLHCAEETGARLIVGNRLYQTQTLPWLRRVVNQWMSRKLSARTGQHLPDSQCGFRLIHLESWFALHLKTNHFEMESEMLLTFAQAGHKIEFVPIQVIPRGTHSHIHPLWDTWRWLRWWWG
jgi:glycosyltransferase involved in cell wall biosynthesis